MNDPKVTKPKHKPKIAKSPAEIPPPQDRKHLTEPTWVENMIYLTGVLLRGEDPDESSDESNPPKSEAA